MYYHFIIVFLHFDFKYPQPQMAMTNISSPQTGFQTGYYPPQQQYQQQQPMAYPYYYQPNTPGAIQQQQQAPQHQPQQPLDGQPFMTDVPQGQEPDLQPKEHPAQPDTIVLSGQ